MSDLRVRDVTEADLPAALAIRTRSFGPLEPGGHQWWRQVAEETLGGRMLAVFDDAGTMLGTGRARSYEQVWGGHHLPMGGVAGVYVEPSARGRGVASLLVRGLIARMLELGDLVSCLYPTVPELYRGVGYEVGGVQARHTYAAHDVRAARRLANGVRPRPARPADAELFHALEREHQVRNRQSGPMLVGDSAWRQRLEREDAIHYVLDGKDGGPRGFVSYELSGDVLTIESLVADTAEAAASLWAVVGSGSSAAPVVRTYLDPRDAGRLVLRGAPQVEVQEHLWMLRVLDLAAAVAARGFSRHVSATADIVLDDPDVPPNSGRWRIMVADGSDTAQRLSSRSEEAAEPGGRRSIAGTASGDPGPTEREASEAAGSAAYASGGGPVRLGPRGLAALWSGWTMSRLRQAGLATAGDGDADAALDAMFAGTPFMTEYF